MIKAINVGTEGWAEVPELFYEKKVNICQNVPYINNECDINVLCLVESDLITPTFSDEILEKFDLILTWRKDIVQKFNNAKLFLYGTKWVEEMEDISLKENKMSFLMSNKLMTSGHIFRHEAFNSVSFIDQSKYDIECNYLISPPRIDSKNQVLDSYKFSVVMENSVAENYFTEKIIDCFSTKTVPLYWGCPNIGEYFDESGIIFFNEIVDLIDKIINLNPETYNEMLDAVEKNFELAKQYYSLWDRIDESIKKFLNERK
jgi:hypothetical protein